MTSQAAPPAAIATKGKRPATRLYAILARDARTGVVFRRGPSRQVQLIRWDLRDDTFEHGQWFKGRIYERRCDLSPSGKLLLYFAATHRAPYYTWTALSKPPFFTALALWPKGDAWSGGGMFDDEETVLLNYLPDGDAPSFPLAEGFRLKPGMQVKPCGQWSGRGEDEPLNTLLLERAGWRLVERGEGEARGLKAPEIYKFSKPQVREKDGPGGRRLQMLLRVVCRAGKPFYGLDYRVVDREGAVLVDLPETDWADWDGGDLVFARAGCLHRLRKSRFRDYADKGEDAFLRLHDFSDARFAPLEAPYAAW